MEASVWLLFALFCCLVGIAWIALSLRPHWDRACGKASATRRPELLRGVGALATLLGLVGCFLADHPSMVFLVWVMALTASVLVVAFTLALRPRWLGWLVAWLR